MANGQFRAYAGNPVGTCTDLGVDRVLAVFRRQAQPAPRTIVFGLTTGRAPIVVRFAGETRRIEPAALGAFVTVYEGVREARGATVTTTVDGRRITRRF